MRAIRLFVFCAIVAMSGGLLSGCASQIEELRSRPTIGVHPDWRFEEGCGYERCGGSPVDFLYGHRMIVRIESFVRLFVVRASFVLAKNMRINIDPSLTTVELPSTQVLQANVFNCYEVSFDAEDRIQIPPIRSKIDLSADPGRDCVFFIFDAPRPPLHEEFKMTIRGATLNGRPLNIPEITFKPILTQY